MVFVATSTSTPRSDQIRKRACVSAAYWLSRIGMDRGAQPDRQFQAGGADELLGLVARKVRLPPARVVPEDPGRDQARRRQGKAAERAPDEVLRPHDAREGEPQRRVGADGAAAVEEREVDVLLRGLDEARPEARLAQDRVEVLRQEVPRDVELPGPEPLGDRGGREGGAKLDRARSAGVALSSTAGCARGRRARGCERRSGRGRCRGASARPAFGGAGERDGSSCRRSAGTERSGRNRPDGSRARGPNAP